MPYQNLLHCQSKSHQVSTGLVHAQVVLWKAKVMLLLLTQASPLHLPLAVPYQHLLHHQRQPHQFLMTLAEAQAVQQALMTDPPGRQW
jgi:hypothetical protein